MSRPWLRDIELPGQTKLFGIEDCPLCKKEATHLVSICFAEGIAMICESCRSHKTMADWYVPPTVAEFSKRIGV